MKLCAFCHGHATRDLWGFTACDHCHAVFFRVGEAMCARADLRCEACDRQAVAIVDGIALCHGCHASVARGVRHDVRVLSMRETFDQIMALPEVIE